MQFRTPESLGPGAYANGCGVWSTQNEFTLDFLVSLPPEPGVHPDTGEPVIVGPQQLVSRIKLPPALIFQLMRNLNAALSQYEAEHGSIPEFRNPGEPD